jgi:hypothetical protein
MRSLLAALGLLASLPLAAQEAGRWNLDIHNTSGTLSGHYDGITSGQPFQVDLGDDLALNRSGNALGFGAEYQGPRFGLELSVDPETFKGVNAPVRNITIDGQTFAAQTQVSSRVKATTTVLNWTIRCLTFDQGWLGVDLGVRAVSMNINASGTVQASANGVPYSTAGGVSYTGTIPLPMVGVAGGFDLLDRALVARAYYHTLDVSGASYNVAGADLRWFPVDWVGIRVFTSSAKLKIPDNSIKKNIDIALNQAINGIGVVFQF